MLNPKLVHTTKRSLVFALLVGMGLATSLAIGRHARVTKSEFTSKEFLAPIKYLSSNKLKGRGDGSRELNEAAKYIAKDFKRLGLEPLGDKHTFFQRFRVTVTPQIGDGTFLNYQNRGKREKLVLERDYLPFSFSKSAVVNAPLVFAGYGITAPLFGYDDYKGIDVKGKIVIVLRHEPQEHNPQSIFAGTRFTAYAEIASKAINARNHGAVGMILVNDIANHPAHPDNLIQFGTVVGPRQLNLVTLQVKAADVEQWLKSTGHSLESLQQGIDTNLASRSFALDAVERLSIGVNVIRNQKLVENVIGVLPGHGKSEQCIVIGAHYDHLGLGNQYALSPSKIGQIFHGADDNASGTSGMMELADGLSHQRLKLNHSIVFIAFAAEETGLLGSSYYTTHPTFPLSQTLAMINLDMIGRVSHNRLIVGGTATSPGFRNLVQQANHSVGFDISFAGSWYGSSDHQSFVLHGIPAIFFFSGMHSDYHKPSDVWQKIDATDGARVVQLVANVVEDLDQLEAKPQFVRVAAPSPSGSQGGYGTYFGSVPDFGQISQNGVRFADVQEGSPAARAGLKAGDVLIGFGEQKIENLYDFTYALRIHKPGDKVIVTVLRSGKKVTRMVTLELHQ